MSNNVQNILNITFMQNNSKQSLLKFLVIFLYAPDNEQRMKSFELTMTKLCSGQEMLYKNQSKGNNSKTEQCRDTVLVHCTSSHC